MGLPEMLAGSAIGSSLEVLLNKMISRKFLEFFKERKFDDRLLNELKLALLTVTAVLSDAEEKQFANPPVKQWLDELRDAVYETEDLLDEMDIQALQSKLETGSGTPTGDEARLSVAGFICKVKMEKLVERLTTIVRQKEILNLKEGPAIKPSLRLPSTSLVDESQVFGRVDDKEMVVRVLLSDLSHDIEVPVVALVGMPGIGKTTLAQLIYNDRAVMKSFGLRAWAHVSEELDVFKVTRIIYESVTSHECNTMDLNILQVRLQEELVGKKFLLVLDDVWNENYADWDVLQKPFNAGAAGSRIVVTTRSSNVASSMRAALTRVLPQLSDDDCWSLFSRHAFRNGSALAYLDMKKRIVKKCNGLPLAAKTLGALLYSKSEIGEWDNVLNSKIWDLPSDKSNILPALKLSYYYLPSHLKRCFAYCSIFPKSYEIEKEKLILLWMAEGLVVHGKRRLEEVAEEYFHELLSRSFFQQSTRGKSFFIMHDLFNDLAQKIAGDFCFKLEDANPQEAAEKVRHFSYLSEKFDVSEKFDAFWNVNHLRTFMAFNSLPHSTTARALSASVPDDLFKRWNSLRVLSLSPYKITKLDDNSIKHLKHLRYLDLSHTLINELPKSACSLCNLETLLLLKCRNLTMLPNEATKLVNLRHLDIRETKLMKMPPHFGRLKSLQFLTDFVVGDNDSSINELKELSDLRGTLSISRLHNVTDPADASAANLKAKEYLSELVLYWRTDNHDAEREIRVLSMLQPHENLKKLTIEGYAGARFPQWLGDSSFSNMVSLHIRCCGDIDMLPPLGQLSSLKELYVEKMEGIKTVGPEFCGHVIPSGRPFRSLEILKFEDMLNWENWSSFTDDGGEQLQRIQELHLVNCPQLAGSLPNHLPSLKSLHIRDCDELKFQHNDRVEQYIALSSLYIRNSCKYLITFHLDCFARLEDCHIEKCNSLEILDISLCDELALRNLDIRDCPKLEFSVGRALCAPNLELLSLKECGRLKSMPEQMDDLTSLQELKISGCPELFSFPQGGLPANLWSLRIENCEQLAPHIDWGFQRMNALTLFEIEGGCSGLESFPEEEMLPVSLTSLHVADLLDLSILNYDGLHHLTNLRTLSIIGCDKLDHILKDRLPVSCNLLCDD